MALQVDERGLPEFCLVFNDVEDEVVIAKRDEVGYFRWYDGAWRGEQGKQLMDEWNEKMSVSKAQAEAMKTGSVFGFNCPGALPASYNADGTMK